MNFLKNRNLVNLGVTRVALWEYPTYCLPGPGGVNTDYYFTSTSRPLAWASIIASCSAQAWAGAFVHTGDSIHPSGVHPVPCSQVPCSQVPCSQVPCSQVHAPCVCLGRRLAAGSWPLVPNQRKEDQHKPKSEPPALLGRGQWPVQCTCQTQSISSGFPLCHPRVDPYRGSMAMSRKPR